MLFKHSDPAQSAEDTVLRLEELRKEPFAKRATVLWAPEGNLHAYAHALNGVLGRGVYSYHNNQMVKLCNYIMYISRNGRLGVTTSENSKSTASNIMYTRTRANMIMVWERYIEKDPKEFEMLVDQMRKWRMVQNKKGTYVYKAPGGKSDHIMALIVGIYAIHEWPMMKHVALESVSTSNLCECETGLCGQAPRIQTMKRIRTMEEDEEFRKRQRHN
jgi:hypothetical protein